MQGSTGPVPVVIDIKGPGESERMPPYRVQQRRPPGAPDSASAARRWGSTLRWSGSDRFADVWFSGFQDGMGVS